MSEKIVETKTLREQKEQNLLFIKEIEEKNCFNYLFYYVDFNKSGEFLRQIQTLFEYLFKNAFLPNDYKIYDENTDKYIYPSFRILLSSDDAEIKRIRKNILKIDKKACDYLLKNAHGRNIQTHQQLLENTEKEKEIFANILFNALKNAYEYKTKKYLEIDFSDFLSSLKIPLVDVNLDEENTSLKEQNVNLVQENLELKQEYSELAKKYELVYKTKKIVPVILNESTTNDENSFEALEEISYNNVVKNDKYIIPKEIGRNIEVEHSSQIDIAIDFLQRSWFAEAIKEAMKANNILTTYIVFLANNKLRNIRELLESPDYVMLLNELIIILYDLPIKTVDFITSDIINYFCECKDINTKSRIFNVLVKMKIDSQKYKNNYINFMIDSLDESMTSNMVYFDQYYSSFSNEDYYEKIVNSFELMLKMHRYKLAIAIKVNLFSSINTPEIAKLMLMAQAMVDDYPSLKDAISKIPNSNYLDIVLNYNYYHDKKEFSNLKTIILNEIKSQVETNNYDRNNNAIILLNSLQFYLGLYEFSEYLNRLISLFKNEKIWGHNTNDALILMKIIKEKMTPNDVISLYNSWFNDSLLNLFGFYKSAFNNIKEYDKNSGVSKIDILLTLSLSNDFELFSDKGNSINNVQIENYLKNNGDGTFIKQLLIELPKKMTIENAIAYSKSFEILLPYVREEESTIFNYMKELSSRLISFGYFDLASRFYRYMLGLKINSSVCYWGLLFCEYKVSDKDELSNADNLFDNELFQAVLHLSKSEDQSIYDECLDLYSSHKNIVEIKQEKTIEKRKRKIKSLTVILLLISVLSSFSLLVISGTNGLVFWPFTITTPLFFVSIIVWSNMREDNLKKIVISAIVFNMLVLTFFATIGFLHIKKAVFAKENYDNLTNEMTSFSGRQSLYEIEDLVQKIPFTYRNIDSIKKDLKQLESYFNYSDYKDTYWNIWNFDARRSDWNCSNYYWDASIYLLVHGEKWISTEGNYSFKLYDESSSTYLNTDLPNSKDPLKDYYYYSEIEYSNNHSYFVNQVLIIGYKNKNDSTDKFDAYKIGNIRVSSGEITLYVYCYSNSTLYSLKLE